MLEELTHSLRIGFAVKGVGLLKARRWRPGRDAVLSGESVEASVLDASQNWSGPVQESIDRLQCAGLATRVVLSDDLVRLFMVTPPVNTQRLQDCHAAAAMRFRVLYDASIEDWQLEADWNARHPFLACAMPRGLRHGLSELMQAARLKPVEIAPQFVVALNRWRRHLQPGAWLGVVHPDGIMLGVPGNRRLHAVRSLRGLETALLDRAGLAALLSREALRLEVPVPRGIQFCGTVPPGWLVPANDPLRCTELGAGPRAMSSRAVSRGNKVPANLRQPTLALAAAGLVL